MTHPHAAPAIPEAERAGTTPARAPLDVLHRHLDTHLEATARVWFRRALDEAAAHPGTHGPISVWELRLAEAGRRCGGRYADAARVLILRAARADPESLARVYFQGTAEERRAVLHALPHLVSGPDALPLVEDALRTHDTRLVAAAVGPYAARHLDAHAWRHAVLKCLFAGVPVDEVAGLEQRADAELARMLGDYATERTAAGRPVPRDLHRVLTLTGLTGLTDLSHPTALTDPPALTDPTAAASTDSGEPTPDLHRTDPPGAGGSHRPAHPHGKESRCASSTPTST
ncbi:EboA domain-containing protein [Streptomyces sp. NBC_00016]|uniref:EboA domain-containing protein n=1 Tax=Streptomyces sp. NBC_00016 TaxID=2975622 RepID=UPI00324886E8